MFFFKNQNVESDNTPDNIEEEIDCFKKKLEKKNSFELEVKQNLICNCPPIKLNAHGWTKDLGSLEEKLLFANELCGEWQTILKWSDPLGPQLKFLGVNIVKRKLFDQIAVPVKIFLEEADVILHMELYTPLGTRHMRTNLRGEVAEDEDDDCGMWRGKAGMIWHSLEWFCRGKPVRALQLVRIGKLGFNVDTKCLLPNEEFKQILFYNTTIYPKDESKPLISANRFLKK